MNEHNHSQFGLNPLPGDPKYVPSQVDGQDPQTTPPLPHWPEEMLSPPHFTYTSRETTPEKASQQQAAAFPPAAKMMAGIIAVLVVAILCLAFHHRGLSVVQAATAVPKDSDIEIQGTSQAVDDDGIKYVFKGRVTNTGEAVAPSVSLKAIFHYTFHHPEIPQSLTGTVLLTTFKNLRPGESRDFECPTDRPEHPDPAPGTSADAMKYPCIAGSYIEDSHYGVGTPCSGPFLHMTNEQAEANSDTWMNEEAYDRSPKPESVTTAAAVGSTEN